jgi:hypothetical protein
MLLLLLSPLLLLHHRSKLQDLGDANNNTSPDGSPKYTLLDIWVIGNEAGWFSEIQVCQVPCVQTIQFFLCSRGFSL